jgi:hypothetical protein
MQMIRVADPFCQKLRRQRGYRVIRFDNRDIWAFDAPRRPGRAEHDLGIPSRRAIGLMVRGPYDLNDMAADYGRPDGRTADQAGACRRRVDGRDDRATSRGEIPDAGEIARLDHVDIREIDVCRQPRATRSGRCSRDRRIHTIRTRSSSTP